MRVCEWFLRVLARILNTTYGVGLEYNKSYSKTDYCQKQSVSKNALNVSKVSKLTKVKKHVGDSSEALLWQYFKV